MSPLNIIVVFSYLLYFLFWVQVMLKPLVEIALKISKLRELTGRDEPTVIT